jgi:hypothetical protein
MTPQRAIVLSTIVIAMGWRLIACESFLDFGDAPESGLQCTDKVDNDLDTLTDCVDPSCMISEACVGDGGIQRDAAGPIRDSHQIDAVMDARGSGGDAR